MRLTRAEEQIMKILWDIEKGTVKDILAGFGDEKPARTTVATVLGVLENKGYAEHSVEGHINLYRPAVTKEAYSRKQLRHLVQDYFGGSASAMFSLFAKEADMGIEDIDRVMEEVRETVKEEGDRK